MNNNNTSLLRRIVNCDVYALDQPATKKWLEAVKLARSDLQQDGCCVLNNFIHPQILEQLEQQSETLAPDAYYTVETVNAYNTDPAQPYPEEHPAGITFKRGNAFVARDLIPDNYLVHQLYTHSLFKQFIAACFDVALLHELNDPLAGLCMNILQPGREHPWHFDTNEFTVSLLTKSAHQGGEFQYCPNIRTTDQENLTDVHAVITEQTSLPIRRLELKCGDLQLFMGRYSLHRVSTVRGEQDRHSAIFSYTKLPNVIGSVERTMQLFGRVLPEHITAHTNRARSDKLLD